MDILVSEVGPRDGLQSVKSIMPTADKHRWIAAMAQAGLREIEVGSFVSARALPQMAATMAECGVDMVNLADSVGYANPAQVKRLFTRLRREVGAKSGGAHLHNTRGQGLANVVAALDVGVTTFDSSQGGIGGCPYAPAAPRNIAAEDLGFQLGSVGLPAGTELHTRLA